jgi:chromosomal replication initiation ATPase DnaA
MNKNMIQLEEYARRLNMDVRKITCKSRLSERVMARQVYWWHMRKNGYTYSEIARSCGWNHSTVLHGVKRVENLMFAKDAYLERYLAAIEYEPIMEKQ